MIDQINNFTFKSFENYSGPENNFNRINLIFGYNGRGKSSLSLGIVDEFVKTSPDDKTNDKYRLFNSDFIKREMLLEKNSDEIKGVRAIFGQSLKNLDEDIKEEEKKLKNNKLLLEEIIELDKEIKNQITNIHDNKKGNLNINNKINPNSDNLIDLSRMKRLYENDKKKALNLEPSEERILSTKGDDELAIEYKELDNFSITDVNLFEINEEEVSKINNIFKKKYDDIEIPSNDTIHWIIKGVTLHQENDEICKFCGSKIEDFEEIIRIANQYKENEKQKDLSFLNTYYKEFEKNSEKIDLIINQEDKLIRLIPEKQEEIEEVFKKIKKSKVVNNYNLGLIQHKIYDFDLICEFKIDVNYYIDDSLATLKEFLRDKKDITYKKLNSLEEIVKGSIAINVFSNPLIQKNVEKINENMQLIEDNNKNNKLIEKRIEDLKKSSSSNQEYTDFMNFMNEILENFTLNFRLIYNETNLSYSIVHKKHSEDNPIHLTIDNISEGEKNLFGLLYFYYSLYEDNNQTKLKSNIKLIIIDDPISSLDDQNRFSVLELVRSIATENTPQVFIFTHVWDDFCQLSYHLNKNKSTNLYELIKDENYNSYLTAEKQPVSPYKLLFKEVYNASLISRNQEIKESTIIHIPNAMRRVFEEFLSFKTSNNVLAQYSNLDKIKRIYIEATGDEAAFSGTKRNKLGSLLEMINVLSHKPVKSSEIPENARFLLSFMEDMDKVHLNALKNDIEKY